MPKCFTLILLNVSFKNGAESRVVSKQQRWVTVVGDAGNWAT